MPLLPFLLSSLSSVQRVAEPVAIVLFASIWQGSILAAAVGFGLRFMPRTGAATRFAIWLAVFVTIAVLPIVHLALLHGASTTGSGGSVAHSLFVIDSRWSFAVLAIWGVCSVARVVTLGMAAVRIRGLWQRAVPVEEGLRLHSRLTNGARVCLSDEVDRPSVIGFFAPRILVPASLLAKLTDVELEQVVLHEMGHLRRRDDWINLLQKAALVVFPLNPALNWVERRLCLERELACDDAVLTVTRSPKAYASCLAVLAEHRLSRRAVSLALGVLGHRSDLGRRVESILRRRAGEAVRDSRFALSGVAALLLMGTAGLARCPQLLSFASPTPPQTTTVALSPTQVAPAAAMHEVVFHPAEADVRDDSRRLSRPVASAIEAAKSTKAEPRLAHSRSRRRQAEPQLVVFQAWSSRPWEGSRESSLVYGFTGQPTEVHTYAALPTREGWLLIQL